MAYDSIYAGIIANDLSEKLAGSKIEKVMQPESDEIILQLTSTEGRKKLLISVSPQGARVHFTEIPFENPEQAPAFCMFLRKYIQGGRIASVAQAGADRIIEFEIETINEMGYQVNKKLICETMGKHSNLILVDMESGKIMDSIKRISIDVNRYRQILPGAVYTAPPAGDNSGYVERIKENAVSEEIRPVVYLDGKLPKDVHVYELKNYESLDKIYFDTPHQALDYFYANRLQSNRRMQKAENMQRTVSGLIDKQLLKKQRLLEDIKKAEEADIYRLKGELLNANLHLAKPGAKSVEVISYYDGKPFTIELDERFPAAKNAQNYFKKYNKLKTGGKEKAALLEACEKDIEYLNSVAGMLSVAQSYEELELIRSELAAQGFVRTRTASKRSKTVKPKPRRYQLSNGMEIAVGRSNTENDYITFKLGGKTDYWFHTKDIHGSHAVLFTGGTEPDADAIYEAAAIAAWFSKGQDSENVPVDYVPLRYVKKPAGAKPGMVIFTNNRTVWINPKNPDIDK